MTWTVEFWEDDDGSSPVHDWWTGDLDRHQRRALGHAVRLILQTQGPGVCRSKHWGRHLGDGLFEFKLRYSLHHMNEMIAEANGIDPATIRRESHDSEDIVLRLFCHAHGDRIILLVNGYDKGADDSEKRQDREIKLARKRLRAWQLKAARQ